MATNAFSTDEKRHKDLDNEIMSLNKQIIDLGGKSLSVEDDLSEFGKERLIINLKRRLGDVEKHNALNAQIEYINSELKKLGVTPPSRHNWDYGTTKCRIPADGKMYVFEKESFVKSLRMYLQETKCHKALDAEFESLCKLYDEFERELICDGWKDMSCEEKESTLESATQDLQDMEFNLKNITINRDIIALNNSFIKVTGHSSRKLCEYLAGSDKSFEGKRKICEELYNDLYELLYDYYDKEILRVAGQIYALKRTPKPIKYEYVDGRVCLKSKHDALLQIQGELDEIKKQVRKNIADIRQVLRDIEDTL